MRSSMLGFVFSAVLTGVGAQALADHTPNPGQVTPLAYRLADEAEILYSQLGWVGGFRTGAILDHTPDRQLGYAADRLHRSASQLYHISRGTGGGVPGGDFGTLDHREELIIRQFYVVQRDFNYLMNVYNSYIYWSWGVKRQVSRVVYAYRQLHLAVRGLDMPYDTIPNDLRLDSDR